jgi:UrcA family protein
MSVRSLFLTAAVALGTAASAQASPVVAASPGDDQRSVRVSVADLDLRKDAGANAALQRIRRAAAMICTSETLSSGIGGDRRYRACLDGKAADAASALRAQFASDPANGTASPRLTRVANR